LSRYLAKGASDRYRVRLRPENPAGMEPAGFFQSRLLANSQIFRRRFAPVFRLFVAHLGALIEAAQAGSLYGRDVHKHVLAAVVGSNKSVPLRVQICAARVFNGAVTDPL
jgi:hypothetical protein